MDGWRKRDLAIGRPRADLDTFLKNLVKLRAWEYPVIDNLKGERYRGLSELRWKSGRTPHRIFGYHQGELEYLMLARISHRVAKQRASEASQYEARAA